MWWADPRTRAAREAERALELGAAGEHVAARRRPAARTRRGDVAARAPQQQRPPARDAQHRVVGARLRSAGRAAGTGRRSRPGARARPRRDSAIGSSETLPLVITSGSPTSASSRWCSGLYGSITPSSADRGATAAATRAPGRAAARARSAARAPASSASSAASSSTSARAAATSGAISANGLSSRCLRARRAATARLVGGQAGEVVAAEALDRDDAPPAARQRGGDRVGAPPARRPSRRQPRRGPQSGQAFGCAWKRRSAGSSVLGLAGRAHREARHRGERAVVRHAADDREPRAAVRAVRRTGSGSGGRPGRTAPRRQASQVAASGATSASARRRRAGWPRSRSPGARSARSERVDTRSTTRERRRLGRAAARRSASSAAGVALGLDVDAARVVAHPAVELELGAPGGARTAGSRRPARRPRRAARSRWTVRAHAALHQLAAARGRRSPAPPGSAGCAASGSRRRGRRAARPRSGRRRSRRARS